MSDENQATPIPAHGWVKVYHPSGLQVSLPVGDVPYEYGDYFANVDAMLAVGFLVDPPAAAGIAAGEQKEDCGYVVRRIKGNRDGGETSVMDLYPANDQAKFAFLSVYLNNDDDIAAFERACGMRLQDIPVYDGDNKMERGKNPQKEAKYMKRAARPFQVIQKQNPRYNAEEAAAAKANDKMYTVPKRVFVRWGNQQAAGHAPASGDGGHTGNDSAMRTMIDAALNGCRSKQEVRDAMEHTIKPNAGKLTEESKQHYRDVCRDMIANPDIPEKFTPDNTDVPW